MMRCEVTSVCVVAAKRSRLWATVQEKLNQLAMAADDSGFDYLFERVDQLEREVAKLRSEIGAGQRFRGNTELQSSNPIGFTR